MSNNKSIKIGVVGLGTVGESLVNILRESAEIIKTDVGAGVEIARVADSDPKKLKDSRLPRKIHSNDWRAVVEDPDISIIVELIGGTGTAHELMLSALKAGKHVVTANKALMSKHWNDILGRATKARRAVGFEASVMAGVPVIRTLQYGLVGNHITSIHAILNGTSNFILTRAGEADGDFDRALKEAQEKGFCEADPTLDVEGYDASQKLSIMSSLALRKWVRPEDVYREGIGELEKQDLVEAYNSFGFVIKPLAIFKRGHEGIEARVHPTFLDKDNPLAAVSRESNAALIESDIAGAVTLEGKGAGGNPAAAGVLADIVEIARELHHGGKDIIVPHSPQTRERAKLLKFEELELRFLLRFTVWDRPGVLSQIFRELSKRNISIANSEIRNRPDGTTGLVYAATYPASVRAVFRALKTIESSPETVKRKTLAVPIE